MKKATLRHSIFGFYKSGLELRGDILSPIFSYDELERFERAAEQAFVARAMGSGNEDHGSGEV